MNISGYKLITCILPIGRAAPLAEALWKEKNIVSATIHRARGTGKITHYHYRENMTNSEKEMLHVTVTANQADAIFTYIFEKAEINKPHGGLMYMESLVGATDYTLPRTSELNTP